MPTRVANRLTKGAFSTITVPDSGSPVTVNNDPFPTSAYNANGSLNVINSMSTPNFRSRLARGDIIMNDVSLSKLTRQTDSGTYVFKDLTPGGFGTRTLTGHWPIVWQMNVFAMPSYYNTLVNDAKTSTLVNAHKKVASSDVLSLVTVAEAKETAQMLRSPFGRADALVSKIFARKAKLIARGVTAAKAGANAWLEYRLGWKPLLFEIESYIKAYVNRTETYHKATRLTARSSTTIGYTQDTYYDGNLNWVLLCKMLARYELTWKVSSGVIYELLETPTEQYQRQLGLRLADIPSTMWEATPLSFVVDRFVDIGSWLTAITPKPGVRILGSWTTVVKNDNAKHSVLNVGFPSSVTPGLYISGGGSGSFNSKTLTYTRQANPQLLPVPSINHSELSFQQNLDHLSLILARLRKL